MDIVKIVMEGYGCDIARGIISVKDYKKVEYQLENVWHKNLYKKLKKKNKIQTYSEDCGLIKGDIKIYVNDEIIVDTQLDVMGVLSKVTSTKQMYPKTDDVVVTTVQHQEGTFCDTIFIIDEEFDVSKLELIKKDVVYNVDNPLTMSLYCEMYYDGIRVPLEVSETDLRNSRLYLETLKNNGKNKNR